jgi:hypothetical protein
LFKLNNKNTIIFQERPKISCRKIVSSLQRAVH